MAEIIFNFGRNLAISLHTAFARLSESFTSLFKIVGPVVKPVQVTDFAVGEIFFNMDRTWARTTLVTVEDPGENWLATAFKALVLLAVGTLTPGTG